MTAFAGDNIWDFHDPDDDLSETFEGNIALQYAWKQLMGEKRSAKRIDEVNRHAAKSIGNWNRLGEKAYSGRTQNAQNIATIGSLVGSGISIASPMLADKWWGGSGKLPNEEFGTYGQEAIDHMNNGGGMEWSTDMGIDTPAKQVW